MFVEAQCKGSKVTGLLVDAADVRRFFPRHTSTIELHLGHLSISCQLQPEFWRGKPVIRDMRLCDWLESKHHGFPCRHAAIPWVLIPVGGGMFKIEPARCTAQTSGDAASHAVRMQAA
jgi:hypothetical protein